MSKIDEKEESFANRLFIWLVIGIVVIVALYATVLIVVTWPISELSISAAGTFGDSFGILTSLFSGIAFAGLIWTILLQRAELRLQRKELVESRRQAVLTRLMTVTQNQISSYRSEISHLQFESIVSPSDKLGTTEMIFTMIAWMEELTQKNKNGGGGDGSELTTYLYTVAKSVRSYQPLIQGLSRCCKANRLLLVNEAITPDEANDIKAHMFAELPAGLMMFVFQLHTVLSAYGKRQGESRLTHANLFDPIRGLENDAGAIIRHENLKFTSESLAQDRGETWLFR